MSHQGYLQHDNRGHGHSGYCRLRFRFGKRIRTVYLGRDEQLIEQVKQELEALQNDQRLHRQAGQVAKRGRRMLRLAKRRMAEVLRQLGMHYHGDAIRRFRRTYDRTDKTLFTPKEE